MLLLERFFRHDEFFVAKALLLLREWKIITVLRVFVYDMFIKANLPIFPFLLFGGYLDGVFIIFGIVRSIIFSGARIAVFGMSDLERRRGSWRLGCLSGGLSSTGSSLSSLLVFPGVSTMYTS